MAHCEQPPRSAPGAYLLIIRLRKGIAPRIGAKAYDLPRGWYCYAGSAQKGLAGRLGRHLKTAEFRHWHIDHLLAAGDVRDIQALPSPHREAECALVDMAASWSGSRRVPGFGASDCSCVSHLTTMDRRPTGSIYAQAILPRLEDVMRRLAHHYSDATLEEHQPFRTLVGCMLSLRTGGEVTAVTTERVFGQICTPRDLASYPVSDLADLIRPLGMSRQKAEQLVAMARVLVEQFQGTVPPAMEALLALPGVGRKTANLVRSFAFHLPSVCVDTHVHRICNRWGLVRTAAPEDTEEELRRLLPKPHWSALNPYLVQHGRTLCGPGRPRCGQCFLTGLCGYPRLLRERSILEHVPGAPPHPCLGEHLHPPRQA